MAEADNVLGISGQIDITNIEQTLDNLMGSLQRLGVETDTISQKMSKALNDIAQSDSDLATKTQQATAVVKSVMEEAAKSVTSIPAAIEAAGKRVEVVQNTIEKLNTQLQAATQGTEDYDAINKQIEAQKQLLAEEKQDLDDLQGSYNSYLAVMQSARAITEQSVVAVKGISDALKEYLSVAAGRAEVERLQSESTKQLKEDIKLYEATIKEIQTTLDNTDFAGKIEQAGKQIELQQKRIEGLKQSFDSLSEKAKSDPMRVEVYNYDIQKAQERIETLKREISDWKKQQDSLNTDLGQYNALLEAAKKIASGEKVLIPVGEEQALDSVGEKTVSVRQRLRELLNEIMSMVVAFRALSDEEKMSPVGQQMAQDIEKATNEYEKLKRTTNETQKELRNASSENLGLEAVSEGVDTVISGFGLAQAAAAAFGLSEEDLVKVQTQLQASLAASNAIKTIHTNLLKSSALMQGIENAQRLAAVAATNLATAAEGKGIVVRKAAAVAQAVLNAVCKANPYVLLAAAIISVIGALAALITHNKKVAEEEKKAQQAAEEAQKAREKEKHRLETLGDAVGDVEAKYRLLQAQWRQLSSESEKAKWIKKNADAFHSLGLNVNSVADAENVLVNMAPQVIAALKAVAEAEAYEDLYKEAIQKKAKEWGSRTKTTATGDFYIKQGDETRLAQSASSAITDEWANAGVAAKDLKQGKLRRFGDTYYYEYSLEKSAIDKINRYRSQQAANLNKELEAGYDKEINDYSNLLTNAYTKAEQAQSAIPNSLRYSDDGKSKDKKDNSKEDFRKENERWNQEQLKQRKEAYFAQQEAEIAAIDDNAEKARRERQLQHEKDLWQIDQQEREFKNANYEHNKTVYENTHKDKYTGTVEGTELTADQKAIIDAQRQKLNAEWNAYRLEQERAEIDTLNNYYKEYGSYQQKKLAIAQEYAEKIRKAETLGEKMSLEKERDQQLANLDVQDITSGIDWAALFNGVGNLTQNVIKEMLPKVEAYTKTDKFQNADSQTQKDILSLINEMRSFVGTDQSVTWQSLADAIKKFNEAITALNEARQKETDAIAARDQAEQDYKNAQTAFANGEISEDELNEAFDNYLLAKDAADAASKGVVKAKDNVVKFGNALTDASDRTANYSSKLDVALNNLKGWENVQGFSELYNSSRAISAFKGRINTVTAGIDPTQAGGKTAQAIGNALSDSIGKATSFLGDGIEGVLGTAMGQMVGIIAQIPQLILSLADTIKNMVTGVLDNLSKLLSFDWLSDLVVSITDAIGNLIDTILDLPENLYHVLESIVVDGVGGLLDSVVGRLGNIFSFGALDSSVSSWFTNSNAKKVADTIERLTERNKLLEQSIEDLKESIDNAYGVTAIKASQDAAELQEETNQNYLDIARAQASYHNAHGSWNHYWGGFTSAEIERLNRQFSAAGLNNNWTGSLWDLSPEQMKLLRSNVDIWERIEKTGKGGYGSRLTEKLDDYIEQAGKLEEITDQLNEQLTTTTAENVFDDFLNSLYELANGSEDVFDDIADNWQQMVNKMVINNTIGTDFQEKITEWYKKVADATQKYAEGRNVSAYKRALAEVEKEYDDYVESAQATIESLKEAGLIQETTQEQSASAKGVSQITYDQANLLVNLGTARNIALEQGNQVRQLIQVDTSQLKVATLQIQSDISVMRDIQEQGLAQITRIELNTRPISQILSVAQDIYRVVKETA